MNRSYASARILNTDWYDDSLWIDDDDLDEIQALLWHGHAPKHDRYDFEVYPDRRVPHLSEKQLAEERRVKAEEYAARERRFAELAGLHREPEPVYSREFDRLRRPAVEKRYFDYPIGSTCFVCDGCKDRFLCTVSEDAIEREYLESFGPDARPLAQRQVFCGSCFTRVMRARG